MRPAYESSEDRRNETRIAHWLAQYWEAKQWIKNPRHWRVDFFFQGCPSRPIFAEIKCRKCRAADSPFYIMSGYKLMTMIQVMNFFNARGWFVFGFNDGEVRAIEPENVYRSLVIQGRTDRGDPEDIEPCVKIPPGSMLLLRKAEPWPVDEFGDQGDDDVDWRKAAGKL